MRTCRHIATLDVGTGFGRRAAVGRLGYAVIAAVCAFAMAAQLLLSRSAAAGTHEGQPTYLWEGRIEVENNFAGRTLAMDVHGRHNWKATYLVTFLEIPSSSSVSHVSGRSLGVNDFVLSEMKYTIQADHHHDYDHKWGDTILRGTAAGRITGAEDRRALFGNILRFEDPAGVPSVSGNAPRRSFASWDEFKQFEAPFYGDPRSGCYTISIAFNGTPHERRQRYHGIERSGSSKPINPDPDLDFLNWVPGYMPGGANVYGCLDNREQPKVQGEYTFPNQSSWPDAPNDAERISIKWSFLRTLCRKGEPCVTPRETSGPVTAQPPPDLCPDPRNQTALLQAGLAQQNLLKGRLEAQRSEYNDLAGKAKQWENDFEHASRDCSLWSAALTLAGFLAGRGPTATTAGGYTYNAGGAFTNFVNLIDKVAVGDPSWMMPDVDSDALPSVETAWDAFRAGYDTLGPAAPEKMLNDLRMCGAPTIEGVMDGAITYLRLMQQIEPMMRGIRETLNDLRAKDNELSDLWNDYHRACLEYAKCKQLPASTCDAEHFAR